jgi:hypothetical protein
MAFVLGDADMDRSFRALKLRPRLEQIAAPARRAVPRCPKIPAPPPSTKARAADRLGLAVPIDHEVGMGGVGRGVKQFRG